jgi:RNA polymerase sigma-70 factor (ECF subfamily)
VKAGKEFQSVTEIPEKIELDVISTADKGAWSALLKRGIPKIFGMFIKRGINPSLAEELTQKTVFDAVRGKDTFDAAKGTAENWLIGIASNNLAAEFRKRAIREISGSELAGFIEAIDRQLLPDEVLELKETALLVRQAMDRLDEKERAVLKGKYVDDLSAREIAEKLSLTEKAVHSLLYRARISLRDKLKSLAPSYKEARKK